MNGIGDNFRVLNTEIVIGTISNIVVTLSINIEIVAVNTQNITINFHIFPLEALLILTPRYSRSEEHTSELQSQSNLVCRLLLEKKKKKKHNLNVLQYKK